MLKFVLIVSFILSKLYGGYLKYLDNSYLEKEPPENVKDGSHYKELEDKDISE